jgi:hypothetical protein
MSQRTSEFLVVHSTSKETPPSRPQTLCVTGFCYLKHDRSPFIVSKNQCCGSIWHLLWTRIRIRGSMPLTNGSGSGYCYFHHWPSRPQQKTDFLKSFLVNYFLKVHLHHFSKIKSQKEQNSRNQGFSFYFCLMIEGSGSGTRRPKNMLIRWIRIRIRIWIRNTAKSDCARSRSESIGTLLSLTSLFYWLDNIFYAEINNFPFCHVKGRRIL